MKRYLILEDGSSFPGEGIGANIISTGELAIQTTNFGYQEALTDPTNAGKILVFTSPMIGNNGINAIDYESIDPTVKGIIANDIALNISDSENFEDLSSFLKEKKIPVERYVSFPTDYRFVLANNYSIFYRTEDDCVKVIRIMYSRRDFVRILFGDNENT